MARKNLLEKIVLTIIICMLCLSSFTDISYGADKDNSLKLKAQSAISYCPRTTEIIYRKDMNKRVVPASTTKLMTAIVVMENLDLDKKVKTTKEMEKINEAEIFMRKGEVFTASELLNAMLIESANDAAVGLAVATSGSVKEFAKLMNKKAKELGLKNSHFVNPNGIKVKNHYSCAYDMAIIAKTAFENKRIRKIAGTKYYKMKATNLSGARKLRNTNLLLPWKKKQEINDKKIFTKELGVFAGKTGTWEDNESSLVLGVRDGKMEFITVILDTDHNLREEESIKLINYTKKNMARHIAFEKGDVVGRAFVKYGEKTRIDAAALECGYVKLPKGASESDVDIKINRPEVLNAPIKKGTKVAEAEMYLDGKLLRKVDLVATEDISKGWLPSAIGISNVDTIVIGYILLFGIILLLVKKKVRR